MATAPAPFEDPSSAGAVSGGAPVQIFGFSDSDTAENNNLPEGHICMKKVMLVEEIKYDHTVKCKHIEEESCFQTYTTVFRKRQVRTSRSLNDSRTEFHFLFLKLN